MISSRRSSMAAHTRAFNSSVVTRPSLAGPARLPAPPQRWRYQMVPAGNGGRTPATGPASNAALLRGAPLLSVAFALQVEELLELPHDLGRIGPADRQVDRRVVDDRLGRRV